jgi:hypothetical protein
MDGRLMRAEILESSTPFEVQPAPRQDGTTGAPLSITITLRPCWRKPAVRLELTFAYEEQGVAYYGIDRSDKVLG